MIFFISTLLFILYSCFLFCNNTIIGVIFNAIFHSHQYTKTKQKELLRRIIYIKS